MVSVLEKKMSKNSRLPPSLLNYGDFWEALETHMVNWAFETLNIECEAQIETRVNINAKAAAEIVSEPTSYLIGPSEEPLPVGILLSSPMMTKYAAQRLSEAPDRLTGTSPVFLQLLCETPTRDLLCRLSDWLSYLGVAQALTEPSFISISTAPLNTTERFVHIVVKLSTAEEEFEVTFLIELQRFLSLHEERLQRLRGGLGNSARTSPALRRSVRNSMLDLEVVMDRMDMSVAACSRLTVGQEIPLPSAECGRLNLVAKTIRGDEDIALGELGVWKNHRALKLTTPVSDGFLRNLVEL